MLLFYVSHRQSCRLLEDIFWGRVEYQAAPEREHGQTEKNAPSNADEDDHDGVNDVEEPDLEDVSEESGRVNPANLTTMRNTSRQKDNCHIPLGKVKAQPGMGGSVEAAMIGSPYM